VNVWMAAAAAGAIPRRYRLDWSGVFNLLNLLKFDHTPKKKD